MKQKLLTTKEVATLLGVTSPCTTKNWLESGTFPGSFQTPEGWRFPLSNVEKVLENMKNLSQRNLQGDLTPDDEDCETEPPLL